MTTIEELVVLEAEGATLSAIEAVLVQHAVRGFPIVRKEEEPILLGYVARPELEHALSASSRSTLVDGRKYHGVQGWRGEEAIRPMIRRSTLPTLQLQQSKSFPSPATSIMCAARYCCVI